MKRKILIISLCLIVFNIYLYAENIRKLTATHYYEGNPKKEMTFYDAKGNELAKEYYHIDGRVMGVKGNIPDGEIFEYFLSGRLKSKAVYASNLLVEESEYYDTGFRKTSTKNEWSGRSLINTEYTIYYPDGTKQQEIVMNGDGDGFSKLYYDNGTLFEDAILEGTYRNGPVTQYYRNGTKMLEGFMKDDMLDGPAKEYDAQGKIIRKINYKEDKIIGNAQ